MQSVGMLRIVGVWVWRRWVGVDEGSAGRVAGRWPSAARTARQPRHKPGERGAAPAPLPQPCTCRPPRRRPQRPVATGDVVVFNTDGREIPIVHRVIKVHQRAADPAQLDILTKVPAAVLTLAPA